MHICDWVYKTDQIVTFCILRNTILIATMVLLCYVHCSHARFAILLEQPLATVL